jgi:hypothetical protein
MGEDSNDCPGSEKVVGREPGAILHMKIERVDSDFEREMPFDHPKPFAPTTAFSQFSTKGSDELLRHPVLGGVEENMHHLGKRRGRESSDPEESGRPIPPGPAYVPSGSGLPSSYGIAPGRC